MTRRQMTTEPLGVKVGNTYYLETRRALACAVNQVIEYIRDGWMYRLYNISPSTFLLKDYEPLW